jgi:hypothetical protein
MARPIYCGRCGGVSMSYWRRANGGLLAQRRRLDLEGLLFSFLNFPEIPIQLWRLIK